MTVKNEKVCHAKFGEGIVTEAGENMVTVAFSPETGEKKFAYPSSFEKFLKFVSPDAQTSVENEIVRLKSELQAERGKREEEDSRRRDEERTAMLEQKRTLARKKAQYQKNLRKKQLEKMKADAEAEKTDAAEK